jgi:L-threonylcarbamoyladenylate synthase
MNKKYRWYDAHAESEMIRTLQEGAIILGTSDTVIGLLAPFTTQGFIALNRIKQRKDKPYLVLAANLKDVYALTDAFKNEQLKALAQQFWPGPITFIVPAKKEVPSFATSATGAIAIRIPQHAGLLSLLSKTGPLFSTSANISHEPVPDVLSSVSPQIIEQVGLIIDGETQYTIPSTILDCTGEAIVIIREGAVSSQRLQPYLS